MGVIDGLCGEGAGPGREHIKAHRKGRGISKERSGCGWRTSGSGHAMQTPPHHNLEDHEVSLCSEPAEDYAFDEPPDSC